jgi:hypothetical protein
VSDKDPLKEGKQKVVVLGLYNLVGVLQNSYFLCEEKGDFQPITLNISVIMLC